MRRLSRVERQELRHRAPGLKLDRACNVGRTQPDRGHRNREDFTVAEVVGTGHARRSAVRGNASESDKTDPDVSIYDSEGSLFFVERRAGSVNELAFHHIAPGGACGLGCDRHRRVDLEGSRRQRKAADSLGSCGELEMWLQ